MEEKKALKIDKKIYYYSLFGIVGIFLIGYLTTSVIPKAMVTLTKAAPASVAYLDSSYILGDKLLAKADGVDSLMINVFVLDKDGKPVSGRSVRLTGADNIKPVSGVTDDQGKIVFNVTSNVEKQYILKATIEGVDLGKSVIGTFRN